MEAPTFIVDQNVGKMSRWLRSMGYDAACFSGENDSQLVRIALKEKRIIVTRDRQLLLRRLVRNGLIRVITFDSDEHHCQIRELVKKLKLAVDYRPFTICLECNSSLHHIEKGKVKERVPPFVYATQRRYMECPSCRRIYWRGTHWQAMMQRLQELKGC